MTLEKKIAEIGDQILGRMMKKKQSFEEARRKVLNAHDVPGTACPEGKDRSFVTHHMLAQAE